MPYGWPQVKIGWGEEGVKLDLNRSQKAITKVHGFISDFLRTQPSPQNCSRRLVGPRVTFIHPFVVYLMVFSLPCSAVFNKLSVVADFRPSLLQSIPIQGDLYSIAINLKSSACLWAATAASYCPSRPGERPKLIATEYRTQGAALPCIFILLPPEWREARAPLQTGVMAAATITE